MAIYGDFEYHAFNDIIKVLQRHTGVLFMRTALAGRSVEMHLKDGTLNALFIDGFPVSEPLRIRDTISTLTSAASGEYSFEVGEITQQVSFPLDDLIRDVISTAKIPDQQLPHQETRFEWQTNASQVQVPPALQNSWSSVSPLIRQGASAIDLSRQLHISEHEARVTLYRLRAAGLVTPQRAAGAFHDPRGTSAPSPASAMSGTSQPLPAQQPQQQAGPVRRLLNALRRLTGGNAL
ncbi:hypothetical protein [Deinococcus sp.]|uniref:hypothetical protein n=1 Tax=Deinococcus sp. TaxID=47478 RepID=UPI0025BB18BF|nr:hypothetical protein [Deinococcus sp.]